jgi:hypothetical protein
MRASCARLALRNGKIDDQLETRLAKPPRSAREAVITVA